MFVWGPTSLYSMNCCPRFGCHVPHAPMPSVFMMGGGGFFGYNPMMPFMQFNNFMMNPFVTPLNIAFNYNTPMFYPSSYNQGFLNLTSRKTNGTSSHSTLRSSSTTSNSTSTEVRTTETTTDNKTKKASAKRKTSKNLPTLSQSGFNNKKADKLTKEIKKIAKEKGFGGYCARSVKHAIKNAGLGAYRYGHAYQMVDILADNENFVEISTEGLDLKQLPAGCVLVYERGVSGASSKYGHTEITMGDGTAGSDGITHNIRPGARVYVPV